MKTAELTGSALDWAVAKCENHQSRCAWMIKDGWKQWQSYERAHGNPIPRYSEDWESAGPIIEKDIVELVRGESDGVVYWEARAGFEDEPGHAITIGPTSLIAAMRCYVASKLGDEIEIPKELT